MTSQEMASAMLDKIEAWLREKVRASGQPAEELARHYFLWQSEPYVKDGRMCIDLRLIPRAGLDRR